MGKLARFAAVKSRLTMLKHETGIAPEFDERREIWRLLGRLSPARRIEWLKWCCKQVSAPAAETRVLSSDGSVGSVYWDSMSLFWGSALSIERAGVELVHIVKGK